MPKYFIINNAAIGYSDFAVIVLVATIFMAILAWLLMYLWNNAVVKTSNLKAISCWDAFEILLICGICIGVMPSIIKIVFTLWSGARY